jgi:uncharacterized protein YbjT (DUF2867 family)
MIVMKIVVTGSLGYVSKPLAEKLIEKGHSVTVISSSAEKQALIEAMGANAAIGSMEDVSFVMDTFSGANAVYCMLAPYGNFADPHNDAAAVIARADAMTQNYVQAIERSGVKRVVYLSSIGADMEKGAGLIQIHHRAENILGQLPPDVNISFMRPSGFYKNLYTFIGSVKNHNRIAARYGGDDMNVFVSNLDIADAIVEQIESHESGRIVRYVASEEMTCNEAAAILGAAIGKPDLKWVSVDDKEQLNLYKSFGMNDSLANQFVEMNNSIHNGRFFEDYSRNKPAPGKVKLKDFAKEFAVVYQQ